MKRLVLIWCIVVYVQHATAAVRAGYSVEWLAHKSEIMAEATPIAVTSSLKGDGPVRLIKARYRIDKVIKGAVSDEDTITVYHVTRAGKDPLELSKAQREKKSLLVFISVARNQFKQIDGKYTYTHTHGFTSAFHKDKNSLSTKLYTPDAGLVSFGYKEVFDRAQAQVEFERTFKQRNSDNKVESGSVNVPFSSTAHSHLYGGSSCFIFVPIYKEKIVDNAAAPPKAFIVKEPEVEPGYRVIQAPQPTISVPVIEKPAKILLQPVIPNK